MSTIIDIRAGQKRDIPALEQLVKELHDNSSFKYSHYSYDKTVSSIWEMIEQEHMCVFVAEEYDGEHYTIVGMFMGFVADYWWGDSLSSSDLLLYITPTHQGKKIAPSLLDEYVAWAREQGVQPRQINIGISTGVNVEKTTALYEQKGFKVSGVNFNYMNRG